MSGALQGSGLARLARIARDAGAWRPTNVAALYSSTVFRRRNELRGFADDDHLAAAANWLARAHDATPDGGVAGRYRLNRGWSSSYPETTGYIIPTFLALESEANLSGFRERARRCTDFLLEVQLESGAFPGLEIAENRDRPSVFNTAQILHGLTAWHRASQDDRALESARRAANWLLKVQDTDGAWRTHLYGTGRPYTYMAHAACWLAEFGQYVGDESYLSGAARHLNWVLEHVDAGTGWVDECGFGDDDQVARRAVTHTIGYTIWGILFTSRILSHERGLAISRGAATAVARRLELSRWLPGKLDWNWKGAAAYACLTGNAQMALIWFELHRLESDPPLLSAACKALDLVKRAQPMTSRNPGIRGGIPGSDPIWGGYMTLAYPNWAAKFFVDALMAKKAAFRALTKPPIPVHGVLATRPSDVPTELPASEPPATAGPIRVVLLTSESSTKAVQFCESWKRWGFTPSAVVIQQPRTTSLPERIHTFVSDFGFLNFARRLIGGRVRDKGERDRIADSAPEPGSAAVYCADRNIPFVRVDSLESATGLASLRALGADLFVQAGVGILRSASLSVPRLGTLNAHMGLLPRVRGMNAAEWSALCGIPVGATVHLIDPGIDTGDILLFRAVDIAGVDSVDSLRGTVDRAQIELLGDVIRWIIAHGALPPSRPQGAHEGRQFFAMHAELRQLLDAVLEHGGLWPGPRTVGSRALEPA